MPSEMTIAKDADILITGGLGYIGSHVAAALAADGYESIILVDNLVNSSKEALYTLQTLYPETVFSFYEADVRQAFVLDAVFECHQIEVVFHMAALKAVGESHQKPWDYYDVNVAGTLALLHVMEANGCRKIVFSSSATVYGSAPPPITEATPTGVGITNPYGKTKWMVEEILRDLAESNTAWRVQVLRYFNPIGAHPSGRLGEEPVVANNLFPVLLRAVAGLSDKPITVFGTDYPTPDGTCVRDYVDVWDLAAAHVGTLRRFSELVTSEPFEVYNVGTGRGVSVFELLTTFEEATGIYVPIMLGDRRAGDLPSVTATVSEETRRALAWEPRVSLADSCRRGWAYMNRGVKMDALD